MTDSDQTGKIQPEKPQPGKFQPEKIQIVITTFEVTPGICQDLVDELSLAYAEVISKRPGFIRSALHVNDAQTRVANYSEWERREDFLAMLRHPDMRERNRRLNAKSRSFEPVMYEAVARY